MTAILFALAVVALVLYGLERNHHRQVRLGSRLAGSADVEDRDLTRVIGELRATTPHPARHRAARRPSTTPARSAQPARSVRSARSVGSVGSA